MSFNKNPIKYGGILDLINTIQYSGYEGISVINIQNVSPKVSNSLYFKRATNIRDNSGIIDCFVMGNREKNRYAHFYAYIDENTVKRVGISISNDQDNFDVNNSFAIANIVEMWTGAPLTIDMVTTLKVAMFNIPYYSTGAQELQTLYTIVLFYTLPSDERLYIYGVGVRDDILESSDKLNATIDFSVSSPIYGNVSNSGGYGGGSFDDSSDIIPIPNKPTLGVSSTGFVNVYHTTLNALQNLGSELFPDIEDIITPPIGDAVADVLKQTLFGINQSVSRIGSLISNSKLIDYIIDCHLLPVTPDSGTAEKIKIGFKQFEVQGNKVLNDYIDFDCGTLSIAEYYQNFIDYVGTRAKLYLPFVGFVPIPNEYFQGGTLSVKYRFNVIDGSFMAYVISTSSKSQLADTVIGSYGGNACVHIPITGSNYANMVSGLLNGTMGTLANAVGGNSVGTISSALSVMSNRPDVQSSNGYNSTSAFLGVRRPYLIIEREVSNFSQTYTEEKGLPSNISKEIGSLSGFVQMDNIHMETLTCTDTEKEMIRQLLEDGVIV